VFVSLEVVCSLLRLLLLRFLCLLCSFLQQSHDPNACEHQIGRHTTDEDWHSLLETKVEKEARDADQGEGHGTDPSRHSSKKTTDGETKREVVILLMSDHPSDDTKTQEREHEPTDETTVHTHSESEDTSESCADQQVGGIYIEVLDDGG
jgi:hypothetical protein